MRLLAASLGACLLALGAFAQAPRDVPAAQSEGKRALELDPSLREELTAELAGLEKRK